MNHSSVGLRIKRARYSGDGANRLMTQAELASKVGVGTPYISKIEAGREMPSRDLLQRIANALGQPLANLLPFCPECNAPTRRGGV